MPYLLQVAVGKRSQVTVFGGDYATKDGTGVRDYIHVRVLFPSKLLLNVSIGDGPSGGPRGRLELPRETRRFSIQLF